MFRHIGKDEAGVSGPEYAVLLLLLVGSLVVAANALNGATTSMFNNAANGINDAGASSGSRSFASNGSYPGPSSSPANSPPSSPTNPPPSSDSGGPGKSDNAPGHQKSACSSPAAKCVAPGQNK